MSVVDAALEGQPEVFAREVRGAHSIDLDWHSIAPVRSNEAVWRPGAQAVIIEGNLEVEGNIYLRASAPVDSTHLIVLGSMRCRNLLLAPCATLMCIGSAIAEEAIIIGGQDSTACAAGEIVAQFLSSGANSDGALEIHNLEQLRVPQLLGYVRILGSAQIHKPEECFNLISTLIAEAVDSSEWDASSPEEQSLDMLTINPSAIERMLRNGSSILL